MDDKTIAVTVEMEPLEQEAVGLLNRPAPTGGAFLLDQRVDREAFDAMKAAGAWHWSADDLEDFDMFEAKPGWRFSLDALKALLGHGYTLVVRSQTVTTTEELDALFTPEAVAAYWRSVEEAHEARERARAEAKAKEQARRAALGEEYVRWQSERLTGLVMTYGEPDGEVAWERVAYFDKETPGAWYTTGDTWYAGTIDGQRVYRREYGNATQYYAPRDLVDRWCEAWFDLECKVYGEWLAAMEVLDRHEHVLCWKEICIGDDMPERLIELHGLKRYVEIAKRERTLVPAEEAREGAAASMRWRVVRRYGLPHAFATRCRTSGVWTRMADLKIEAPQDPGVEQYVYTLWRVEEDGQIWGRTYMGRSFPLTEEQVEQVRPFLSD